MNSFNLTVNYKGEPFTGAVRMGSSGIDFIKQVFPELGNNSWRYGFVVFDRNTNKCLTTIDSELEIYYLEYYLNDPSKKISIMDVVDSFDRNERNQWFRIIKEKKWDLEEKATRLIKENLRAMGIDIPEF